MKDVEDHLNNIQSRLTASPMILEIEIVSRRELDDRGYFRARLKLINHDFLEVSEYFEIQAGVVQTKEYRHQWMDGTKQELKKRWDNATHYPDLPNFPNHIHVGSENQVVSGQLLSIIELIDVIEQELEKT
ncbi:MAG: hypothetical protein ISR58_14100 [Anaerolineales bacterium]|nr:hypothetical protein [Chloroflexota bacterium]MBL6982307.1 hypothetical protein [Anaerolineales bacterium]